MVPIDWRRLYDSNQASIRRGIGARDEARPRALRDEARPRALRDEARPRALIHIPRRLDPLKPAPLLCLLHGCTQDPASFAAATAMNDAADRHGFVVVYPGQGRGANPQGCWNWFLSEHQRRGAGEPAAIARIVGELLEPNPQCTIDRRRVYVAGLSAGGAMAVILGTCYPDLFAAVAVHSGLAYNSATDMTSALRVMASGGGDGEAHGRAAHAAMGQHSRPVPSIVIHGSADRTVAPANAREVLRQSMTANHLAAPHRCENDVARPTTSCRVQDIGGHPYTHSRWNDNFGTVMHELVDIDGLGHAWSGGAPGASYSDPRGPSATEAIWAFFALSASSPPGG